MGRPARDDPGQVHLQDGGAPVQLRFPEIVHYEHDHPGVRRPPAGREDQDDAGPVGEHAERHVHGLRPGAPALLHETVHGEGRDATLPEDGLRTGLSGDRRCPDPHRTPLRFRPVQAHPGHGSADADLRRGGRPRFLRQGRRYVLRPGRLFRPLPDRQLFHPGFLWRGYQLPVQGELQVQRQLLPNLLQRPDG